MTTKDLVKVNYHVDEKAQCAVWAHCANAAFLGAVVDMVEFFNGGGYTPPEICVTKDTEANIFDSMGFKGMGLFLKGKVTAMFTQDIGSRIAKILREYSLRTTRNYLVEKYEDLKPSGDKPYTESFLIPTEILGIWMTREKYENYCSSPITRRAIKRSIGDYPTTVV